MRTLGKTWILNKVFNRDTDALKVELGNDENGPLLTEDNPGNVVLRGNDGTILSTIKDDEDKEILRIVDAAPFAYNADALALKTIKSFKDVTFMDAKTSTGDGTVIDIEGYSKIVIEIYGTSTIKTVNFLVAGLSEVFSPIEGFKQLNISTPTFGSTTLTNTSSAPEVWEFENIEGLKQFKCNLSAIANGNCTIKGVLIG